MKSLQVLFEMFMPEARFPDEKFWQKDGSPIHPEPKGPPRGTVGSTHFDLGVPGANTPPNTTPTSSIPAIYPNIHDLKKELPDAYRKFQNIMKDLGMSEQDVPEEAFHYDEDGTMTVEFQDKTGDTHELFWNEPEGHWEYIGIQ